MSPKKGGSSWQDEIESTLQRIQRQSSSSVARPPDGASAAIGQGLAERMLDGMNQQQENAKVVVEHIVTCLCETNNASLSQSFLDTLAAHARNEFVEWIPQWILQAEEACIADDLSPCLKTLYCMISAYATCCCKLDNDATVVDTYNRLQLASSRTGMLREFIRSSTTTALMTPLMACNVLNLTSPHAEKMLFLSSVHARGWDLITNNEDNEDAKTTPQFLMWTVESLFMFLHGIPNEPRESQSMSMELAYQWLLEIAKMMLECSVGLKQEAHLLLSMIFNKILPHFVVTPGQFCIEPIVDSLCNVVVTLTSEATSSFDCATWFRLGTLVLSTPIMTDVCSLLTLLGTLITTCNGKLDGLVQGILHSLVCIFADNDEYKDAVSAIRKQLKSTHASESGDSRDAELTSIVQLFGHGQDESSLLTFMTTSLDHTDPAQASAFDQTSAILLGCSLLCRKTADADIDKLVRSYLKVLLQQLPHLGINLLPILFQSIQTACDNNDGMALLHELEFLCDAVVKDANCAQQVWNLVGVTMVQQDSPTSVRSAAIRMFPRLCANNKKLYRRVVDTLGILVDSKEPEIRLAVAATIDDLAREDRIRDVSDVIGWIQSYLSDENSSVVYYAVSSLHHLVVAEELDFALVMKVLNKRLCPIGDVDMLLELPGSVLEALVLLLGDGECDTADSDDEVTPTKAAQDLIGVPPQVSSAVDTLILLANSEALQPMIDPSSEAVVSRIRTNICKSLSGYSLHSLGLDDEGVQSAVQISEESHVATTDSGLRYIDLKYIASNEMQASREACDEVDSDSAVALTRKIVSLEEESLGSSVWQKRGRKFGPNKPDRTTAPKAAFSALPSLDQIDGIDSGPSFSTAIASLLCYSGESVEDLFNYAGELSGSIHDPISHVFILQGWLRAMGMIWKGIIASNEGSKLEAVASVVEEVTSWRELLDNSDLSYLALAAFSIYVPDTLSDQDGSSHVDFSTAVEDMRNDVRLAFESYQFESRDMADLCLGIVGARAVHSRATAFVNESIVALEQSISEHTGQVSFGASYGLAVIAQAAAAVAEETDAAVSSGNSQQLLWISNITSLLVCEITSCLPVAAPAFVTLVACLKTGKPAPDLLSSISSVTEEADVPETNEQKARCLLLSLALCLRAVGILSPDLLLCLYRFIEKLPWGIGKGFVVPCAAVQCVAIGVLDQDETNEWINECVNRMKVLIAEREMRQFNDVLYACVTLKTFSPFKGTATNELKLIEDVVKNYSTGMSDECLSWLLLTATVLVSTFPCLANGGRMFCSNVNLHPRATKDAVSGVVSLLTDVVNQSGSPKSADRALESLGLLASAKNGLSDVGPLSVFRVSPASSTKRNVKSNQNRLDLEMLPSAHDDTLLEAVVTRIKPAWDLVCRDSNSAERELPRLLSCLEPLSLPSEFARTLIEPILSSPFKSLKSACVKLLVSQVSGRRRAAFDGRDFVKLVNRLALLPPASFQSMMGNGSGPSTFIASLDASLLKLPSDNVEAILLSLWAMCEVEIHERSSSSCAVSYLSALACLLGPKPHQKGSSQLSPRTRNIIVQVLLQNVISTLASEEAESLDLMHPLQKSFLDCLSNLDVTVLDENKFLVLRSNSEDEALNLSKAFCISGLISRQYFEQEGRSSKQLLKLVAWFASGTSNLSDTMLRELAFRISIATKYESEDGKKEIMSVLFEALHIHGPGPRLELLGMLASTWTNGLECDPETSSVELFFDAANQDSILLPVTLSSISGMLLKDMPCNMGAYGRSTKLQGQIANNVLRIIKTWSEQGAAQQNLSLLEGILICCRSLESAKEHDLAALMALQLSKSLRETNVSE